MPHLALATSDLPSPAETTLAEKWANGGDQISAVYVPLDADTRRDARSQRRYQAGDRRLSLGLRTRADWRCEQIDDDKFKLS